MTSFVVICDTGLMPTNYVEDDLVDDDIEDMMERAEVGFYSVDGPDEPEDDPIESDWRLNDWELASELRAWHRSGAYGEKLEAMGL